MSKMVSGLVVLVLALFSISFASPTASGQDHELITFEQTELTDVYYSEGANFGDINQDGFTDFVYGPYWFEGPKYKNKHEIYKAVPQNVNRYADHFFAWVYDFNRDTFPDIFTVGFPGTPAFVYENPGQDGYSKIWTKHKVFERVCNESPFFTDIVGDERPELICTYENHFGYATIDWDNPFSPWTYHRVSQPSPKYAPTPFGHGLGASDINGDGRKDIIFKNGWYEQPESLEGDPEWNLVSYPFAPAGGAEMYAYDVDGDGDNDVITSMSAHNFGLNWYEQLKDGDKITFRPHVILGSKVEDNKYGLLFSELHSVNLADMDGDGLKDIVTGKTYWSHHTQSPMWDAGAVVYWFKLVRNADGVDWVPHQAAADTGVGRQVIVGDFNKDNLPDIVVGGMKGANFLIQKREKVSHQVWESHQPQPRKEIADGLLPEEAAKQMTLQPGFQVELAAGEPSVHQPIAMAIDHRGRIWIAEAYTYPIRAPEGEGKDKIVILEDTDGNGSLDSRKVFAEGLNLVSGLEVGFGGVWVGAAPYLMFIPDADGDDVPDSKPQILLDGFGYQDTHETLNAFNWGPDGWLYGCHGVFTHSRIGKPGTPDAERTPMNAAVWRYHPVRHEFDIFSYGTSNPWGVDFNDHGHAFITACVIPHLWHIIQGARYQRQGGKHFNPHVYDDIKTIADHAHYVGNIRDHAWWGNEPVLPSSTSQAGGGHAHAGAMIYLGDNWPDEYRNQIYFNNIHGNRVNSDHLEREGSGYVGHHGPDFLFANDHWYRGINLRCGPDGSVYLIDWYDKNACHRRVAEIWDRTNGRVYNVSYGDIERVSVNLEKMSDAELVQLHLHKNDWYVRTSRKILQHRHSKGVIDKGAIESLREIAFGNPDVTRQLRGIWTLHALDHLSEDDRYELLSNPDENVRSWAIQLELEDSQVADRQVADRFLAKMNKMAREDEAQIVRLYLTSAMQRIPESQRWTLAEGLISHSADAEDHNLPLMNWFAIEPLVTQNPARAMNLARQSKIPLVTQYIIRRAAADPKSLNQVVDLLTEYPHQEMRTLILTEMLQAFEGRVNIAMPNAWTPAYDTLSESSSESIRDLADQVAVALGDQRIFPRMRAVLVNKQEKLDKRKQALQIIVKGRDPDASASLLQLVSEPTLRAAAIRALANYDNPETPSAILGQYQRLSASDRRDAVNTLVTRVEYANALLNAVDAGLVSNSDIHAYNVRQLLRFENESLTNRIKGSWGEIRQTSQERQKQIAQLKSQLENRKRVDASHGRFVFNKTCSACHTLFGEGGKIGPDLTGSNRANLDYILENILDPSAVLGKDYRMTLIETVDGRIVSGLVTLETDSAVTLQTINDKIVIAKEDIEDRRLSVQSMMPEGLLEPLSPIETKNLVAYLASPSQVTLKGPRPQFDAKGNVAGAIEGESIKVVGKTGGQAKAQPMGNFAKDQWSGNSQLFWIGAKPGNQLSLEVPVASEGVYRLQVVLTKAQDYASVQLSIDDQPLGSALDLYNAPDVITTGMLSFEGIELSAGAHQLNIEIVGANPKAKQSFMVGVDFVRLIKQAE